MAKATLPDEHLIDYLLGWFYMENDYTRLMEGLAARMLEDEFKVNRKDGQRIWRKLIKEEIIEPDKRGNDSYCLSDKGMWLVRNHGTYSNYINQGQQAIKKKEKLEQNDRIVKNIGILSTLGVSLLTLFLTQWPINKQPQQ